jgi:hypothetical protein
MRKEFIQQRFRRKNGPPCNGQKDESTKAGEGNAIDACSMADPNAGTVEPNDSLLLAAAAAHQFGNLGSFFDNVGDQFVAQQQQQQHILGTANTNLSLFNQLQHRLFKNDGSSPPPPPCVDNNDGHTTVNEQSSSPPNE